jgi:hypothetical protein
MYDRLNSVIKPKTGDAKIGKRKKRKLPEIHKTYDDKGTLHFCFRAQTDDYDGWFVFVSIPPKVRQLEGKTKGWFAMHSVHKVNSPLHVNQYVVQNIFEGDDKKVLLKLFMERLENGELPNYHDKTQ